MMLDFSLLDILTQVMHRHKFIKNACKYLLYLYLRLFFATYRLTITYDFDFNDTNFNKNQGIYYCWHQNIIATMFFFYRNRGFSHCMVSPNEQSEFISFCAEKLGFKLVAQDKYKSSSSFLKQAIDVLDVNKRLYVVGDGNRGPAFRLQRSVRYLAEKSGVPLVFIECSNQWEIVFRHSWDQFKIPLPFSKIHIRMHKPYHPASLSDKPN